jgi:hypothetical protein
LEAWGLQRLSKGFDLYYDISDLAGLDENIHGKLTGERFFG